MSQMTSMQKEQKALKGKFSADTVYLTNVWASIFLFVHNLQTVYKYPFV